MMSKRVIISRDCVPFTITLIVADAAFLVSSSYSHRISHSGLLTKAAKCTHTSLWRAVTSAGRWVTRIPGERLSHPIKHEKKTGISCVLLLQSVCWPAGKQPNDQNQNQNQLHARWWVQQRMAGGAALCYFISQRFFMLTGFYGVGFKGRELKKKNERILKNEIK